jgi:hypothetical protein
MTFSRRPIDCPVPRGQRSGHCNVSGWQGRPGRRSSDRDVLRAVGLAPATTPLTVLATAGLDKADAGSASALLDVMRNMGGAMGIAGLQAFLLIWVKAGGEARAQAMAHDAAGAYARYRSPRLGRASDTPA